MEKKMIRNSKQNWAVGSTVKIGFMSLKVAFACRTPGDYAPDAYLLTNSNESRLYKFVPHNGISGISIEDAKELMAAHIRAEEKTALYAYEAREAAVHINRLFA
jgi:hypothetical protein